MKKICFVVAHPITARAFLRDHISALQNDGYMVHLVANFSSEEPGEDFRDVVLHDIPIQRDISLVKDWKALWKLFRFFRKERFDVIHSVTPKAGLLSMVAGRLAGVPGRLHIFTGQVWATRAGFMRRLLKTMDRITAACATGILVDGEGQRQFLIEEGVVKDNDSLVLANGSIAGVNTRRFTPSAESRALRRKEYGISDDRMVFVFLGRLNRDKGIGELFEAFDKIVPSCPDAALLLLGTDEGGYDAVAEKYPNIKRGRNYFYPGYTSCVQEALQAGDVFVLPTYREGFGSSVIEASCLGLPVICSDAYGVMDAMVDGETGLRCKVGDTDSLAGCMKRLYEDPGLRARLGANGRARVLRDFSSDLVTGAWVDYYRRILE